VLHTVLCNACVVCILWKPAFRAGWISIFFVMFTLLLFCILCVPFYVLLLFHYTSRILLLIVGHILLLMNFYMQYKYVVILMFVIATIVFNMLMVCLKLLMCYVW